MATVKCHVSMHRSFFEARKLFFFFLTRESLRCFWCLAPASQTRWWCILYCNKPVFFPWEFTARHLISVLRTNMHLPHQLANKKCLLCCCNNFKGALCCFGGGILIRREKSSLNMLCLNKENGQTLPFHDWVNKLTLNIIQWDSCIQLAWIPSKKDHLQQWKNVFYY